MIMDDYTNETHSSGVAKAALATAIPAAAVAGLNYLNGKGSILGRGTDAAMAGAVAGMIPQIVNSTQTAPEDHSVCRYDLEKQMEYERRIAEKDLRISELNTDVKLRDANIYTDKKIIDTYTQIKTEMNNMQAGINNNFASINQALAQQAVKNQHNDDMFDVVNERLECCKSNVAAAIRQEAQTRAANDQIIVNYANATFYPKRVADVTTDSTTTAQPVYNPIPNDCNCGGVIISV